MLELMKREWNEQDCSGCLVMMRGVPASDVVPRRNPVAPDRATICVESWRAVCWRAPRGIAQMPTITRSEAERWDSLGSRGVA